MSAMSAFRQFRVSRGPLIEAQTQSNVDAKANANDESHEPRIIFNLGKRQPQPGRLSSKGLGDFQPGQALVVLSAYLWRLMHEP